MDLDDLETTLTQVSPRSRWSAVRLVCLSLNAAAVLSLIIFWMRRRNSRSGRAALVAVALPLVCTASGHSQTTTEFTLPQVQQQIEQHQRFLRMCGPLSAIRALSLLGRPVNARSIVHRYRDTGATGVKLQQVIDLCREFDVRSTAIACQDRNLRRLSDPLHSCCK